MNCKCDVVESILAVVILVFLWWPELLGLTASKWIVTISAVILLIHAIFCKNCKCEVESKPKTFKAKKKKRR